MNYFEWTSDSTSPYNGYNYTSKDKTYYGVHTVEVQFGNNPPVSIEAKFDTGAKSTSISFPLGKIHARESPSFQNSLFSL